MSEAGLATAGHPLESVQQPGRRGEAGTGRAHLYGDLRWAALACLGVVLALLPFEGSVGMLETPLFTATELEAAVIAWLVVWTAHLLVSRRLPSLPRAVGVALLCLLGLGLASALAAPAFGDEALRFLGRSLIFWLAFCAAADLVRADRQARTLLVMLVAGAAVSGAIGLLAWSSGSAAGLPGAGQLFTVGGVPRVAGTFDYPNTAAMAWEAVLLSAVAVLAVTRDRWLQVALAGAGLLIGTCLLLTYSRGALIGVTVGLAALLAWAAAARHRPLLFAGGGAGLALLLGAAVLYLAGPLPIGRLLSEADDVLYGAAYEVPGVISLAPGEDAVIPVRVVNRGRATWQPGGPQAFHLAYHWLDPDTLAIAVEEGQRTELPTPVAPGESVTLQARVIGPPAMGPHVLAWDMIHEDVTWFSEKGVLSATTLVRVRPDHGSSSSGVPPVDPGLVELYPDIMPVPERLELWTAGLAMVERHPLLGVGPGLFRLVYGEYLGWPRWDTNIHSNDLYVELVATTGLLGLAAFAVLVLLALRPPLRVLLAARAGRDAAGRDRAAVIAGLAAAVAAYLAHGVLDYFLGFTPTGLLFWIVLGMALGLAPGVLATLRAASRWEGVPGVTTVAAALPEASSEHRREPAT